MRFTVFTPCYNSSRFIHRVFSSLKNQTYKEFEWLVVNDASIDNTEELIKEFIREIDFQVQYFDLKENQGIHANINLAIKKAKGDYLVLLGHDDEMLPNALKTFDEILEEHETEEISAVYGLAKDQKGQLVGKQYPKYIQVSDYWTQFMALENEEEKFQCFRVKYLRKFYPINTNPLNPQLSTWLWGKLGSKYKAVFINEVLRIYYTDVTTSITNTETRSTNPLAVYNYYKCWVNEFQYKIKGNWRRRVKGIGGYVSYGLRSNLSFISILRNVNTLQNKVMIIILFPVAIIYNFIYK